MSRRHDVPARPKPCAMCGRAMDLTGDAMSTDCGGDCWECVGRIEADGGCTDSIVATARERAAGLRD